ncbi:phosphoglycerate mutase-like protein [Athelia psychrophila]|uniref:Phosphoglycerate mutase-like protein n=1 Tax=Athelia psychrophila TaxID=1759441 RepID=A0A166STG3_9AGAM|nr:phosphoglycerate mutase-like protein [Fibularhizoctonia sp. CBS 109695]
MTGYIYQAVPSFFAQDDPLAEPDDIGALPPRFGLLDDSPDHWSTFKQKISQLNADAKDGAVYKVFYLGRHGQGLNNVAAEKYGMKRWNEHWAVLNGDGELVWGPDALLSDVGEQQARDVHAAWEVEISNGVPLPGKVYTSPLTRAMQTNAITFEGLYSGPAPTTVILENCREYYGKFSSDKRQTRARIHANFPQFDFEEGFVEEDELWIPSERETEAHVEVRARKVFDRVFDRDPETFISITAHAGVISAMMHIIGREGYYLPTGGVLPVVIKATPMIA